MKGLIHIYCGDGKGKTSAAFGLALRCAGHKEKIIIAQFLKEGDSGECAVMRTLPNVQVFASNPSGKFSYQMDEEERACTIEAAQRIFKQAVEAAQNVRMLVLDEVMAAITCGFLTLAEVIEMINQRPKQLEIVLTGRNPPQELIELANYVSEIRKIKHPFDNGIAARQGIEK